MKKVQKILVASALVSIAGTAMADEPVIIEPGNTYKTYLPTSFRAEAGTTGYGGALTWDVNPYVGVSLGYNGGHINWRNDIKSHGTKYDLNQDNNNNVYLNAEMHPWGASSNHFAKSVYVAAGVAYLDDDYKLTSKSNNGNVTVNDTKYNITGNITGKMKYKNEIAPYVGIGMRPMLNEHWGVFGEVGAYYTDNPAVTLTSNATVNSGGTNAQFQNDLKAQENQIANEDKYKWLPSAKVGVIYRF
ncbi:hypothetical protein E0H77_03785 [Acinetobacter sp. ANC 4633]|uniref:ornithine uptake porin CarO n=1 Tax=Acinetobacter sp. ANC 4633 TaxID=2529845 RepID=UPI00103FE8EC|nr:ornithine uptake porin CarO [Acinetobacter sp. ANC 4633]TCB27818.1 hypothetical protein E0H77_03785 [Acinetobacter sp. ANC 4633]